MPDAIYKQAIDAVVTKYKTLTLTGIEAADVVARRLPADGRFRNRGITVSWLEPSESRGTNERDDWAYPCVSTLITGSDMDWHDELNRIADFRQQTVRTFHNTRLTGISETGVDHILCRVDDTEIESPSEWAESGYNLTQLVIWCWFREHRVV